MKAKATHLFAFQIHGEIDKCLGPYFGWLNRPPVPQNDAFVDGILVSATCNNGVSTKGGPWDLLAGNLNSPSESVLGRLHQRNAHQSSDQALERLDTSNNPIATSYDEGIQVCLGSDSGASTSG